MDFKFEQIASNLSRTVESFEQDAKPMRKVLLSCNYAGSQEALWQALTDSQKLAKWFNPVTGELKLGGRFKVLNNAGGSVLTCTPASEFSVTWEFGLDTSLVEVSLIELPTGLVRLSISHTMSFSDHWVRYGAGATGVGWEMSLYGLARYLLYPEREKLDEMEYMASPMGRSSVEQSSEGWIQADIDSGASPEQARQAGKNTLAFYTGEEVE